MPERSTAEPRTWRLKTLLGSSSVLGPDTKGEWVEVVELSRYLTLEAALEVAADDLGKAANQFASIREGQRAGHAPEVRSNPELFGRKEARARAALASAGPGGEQHGK